MKYIITPFIALLLFISTLALAQAPNLEAMDIVTKSIPDGPIARVGEVNINKLDFILLYRPELNRFAVEKPDVTLKDFDRVQIGKYCTAVLIEHELLYQEAKRNNLSVSKDMVNKQAIAQFERLQKSFSASAEKPVSESAVLDRLGYTQRFQINQEIERGMLIKLIRDNIIKEHGESISAESVEKVYEKNKSILVVPDRIHLRQIFIKADLKDEPSRAAAKKKADATLNQLFSGQRFEKIAKEVSSAPDAKLGGDMGFLPMKAIPEFMHKPIEGLQKEDITDVFESDFGYHILQLVDKKESKVITKEKALAGIRGQLAKHQSDEAVRDYCDRIIQGGTKVKVFLELDENLARVGVDPKN